jgi:hypothetical protein
MSQIQIHTGMRNGMKHFIRQAGHRSAFSPLPSWRKPSHRQHSRFHRPGFHEKHSEKEADSEAHGTVTVNKYLCAPGKVKASRTTPTHMTSSSRNSTVVSSCPSTLQARLAHFSAHMASATVFPASTVPQAPEDPLFGLMTAYRADTFEKKVDLGIGAYRDDNAKPWVLPVVEKVCFLRFVLVL